jgi:hypothetical protein
MEFKRQLESVTDRDQWRVRGAEFVAKVKATKLVWFPPRPASAAGTAAGTAKKATKQATKKSTSATKRSTGAAKRSAATAKKPAKKVTSRVTPK